MSNWQWYKGELIKRGAKVGKIYPVPCEDSLRVCDPVATSFGDECGVIGCNKVS